ncbi:class I SAM-dependent methyltransferase [Hyphomicrobium sulfonivorans]|uniref:class I SAM-dependent methyltransferase n=1 Tax=Hyphomicrobium sulfonivorans TaxID=121290 RepID=UPI000838BEC2|nr:methyltransferase domain-containing protein [Hyphomicrobium sulfonivorans]
MTKSLVETQFGASAASYATSSVHASGASLARLVALTSPMPNWKALDVATGAGHTALAFAPLVAQVFASDITDEMLAETRKLAAARALLNVATTRADAATLPFDDDAFDLVTCRLAAHHFDDIPQFVREAWRVLKPGGVLAIADNVGPDALLLPDRSAEQIAEMAEIYNAYEKLRDPSHVRCFGLNEWLSVLTETGFDQPRFEVLDQDIVFEPWIKRMRCDVDTVDELETMLENNLLIDFLRPRTENDERLFTLQEAIIVARKPEPA